MCLATFTASLICTFAKLLTGVQARWSGCAPIPKQRIYFANHSSHGDFVLIWSCLPKALQQRTRPVAASDYWLNTPLKRYIIQQVFQAVLIDRKAPRSNPVELMNQSLQNGDSLIIFPEGTRHLGDDLLPFKSGIYHLALAHPEVELVPVWIENLGRALPKGAVLPVPLLCSVNFGTPCQLLADEDKRAFLQRMQQAVLALAPVAD